MTNREWINSLNDEEFIILFRQDGECDIIEPCCWMTDRDCPLVNRTLHPANLVLYPDVIKKICLKCQCEWLQKEHKEKDKAEGELERLVREENEES